MPTYLIEREIPGANKLTDDELLAITTKSNAACDELNATYDWCYSFVAGDKIYCVHAADSPEVVMEHARLGGFPCNLVAEISAVFGANGLRALPR